MTQKFKIGESVRLTFKYYGGEYLYEGTIRSYDGNDDMYWIDLGFPAGKSLSTFIPSGLVSRLSVVSMNGTWHVYRGNRGLTSLIYSDGLDNWI